MAQPNQPSIRIIALALHNTILIYVFVVFFMASQGLWTYGWSLPEDKKLFLMIFTAMAAIAGALSLYWPRIAKGMAPPPSVPHEVNQAPLFFDFSTVSPKLQSLTILRMALAESIAIFGLVLSFLTHAVFWILPFAAAALLLQVLVGPFGRFLRGS